MGYCNWDNASGVCRRYHDREWGVPVFDDDRHQFEHLMLEVMQCGLSWDLVINRREVLRQCFDDFDFEKVAKYTDADVERIMNVPKMIHSPRKINAIISNANRFIELREKEGSFCDYLWRRTGGKIIVYDQHPEGYVPASNGLSTEISSDLRARGFKYVGPVTIYSHLQSVGFVHDHDKNCPCGQAILEKHSFIKKPRDNENNVHFYN